MFEIIFEKQLDNGEWEKGSTKVHNMPTARELKRQMMNYSRRNYRNVFIVMPTLSV